MIPPKPSLLKKIDERSVATAMIDIFSMSGLPIEILTYQGSVFMRKLMKQLCTLLDIKPIKTSPYHPQTDGLLERWHFDLRVMLKKAMSDKRIGICISPLSYLRITTPLILSQVTPHFS